MAHCWTEEKSIKGKFCNVCRKKMQEVPGVRCEGEYASQSVDGKILKSLLVPQHQKKISLKNCVRIRPGKVTFLFFRSLIYYFLWKSFPNCLCFQASDDKRSIILRLVSNLINPHFSLRLLHTRTLSGNNLLITSPSLSESPPNLQIKF